MLEPMKLLILSVAVLLASVLMLGVKVLFVKGGKFPSTHIGSNPEMRRRGIGCAHERDS